jgi:hypothetical protein
VSRGEVEGSFIFEAARGSDKIRNFWSWYVLNFEQIYK